MKKESTAVTAGIDWNHINWDDLEFGVFKRGTPEKTIEQKRENPAAELEQTAEAWPEKSRCVVKVGNDEYHISAFFSTKRLPLHKDGRNYIRVVGEENVPAACRRLAKEIRDGRFDEAIEAESARRKRTKAA